MKEQNKRWWSDARAFFYDTLRIHKTALTEIPVVSVVIIILSAATAVSGFLVAGSSALLIDAIIRATESHVIPSTFVLLVSFAIGSFVLPDIIGSLREYFDRMLWLRLSTRLDVLFLRARLSTEVAQNEDPLYQDTLAKATDRGIYPILNVLDSQYAMLADILMLMIASVVLVGYDPLYLVILFIGATPRFIVGLKFGREVWTLYDLNAEERRRFYFLRNFPDEGYRLMEAHLLSLKKSFVGRLQRLAEHFLSLQVKTERSRSIWVGFSLLVSMLSVGIVYLLAISSAVEGAITIGSFIFLTAAIGRFADPLQRLFIGLAKQYEFDLFAREVFRVLDVAPKVAPPKHPHQIDPSRAPEIRFEGVTFRYPKTSTDVLKGVSLTIPSGSSLALVGINGAGKTTLVKLLCRFYDPTEGRILVDGIDLREIDLASWYRALAVLFQHFPLYRSYTAGESIVLGAIERKVEQAHIEKAAKDAGADEIIRGWRDAYDQMLGKEFTGGVDPSRGQEQRLALARMFYRDAACLILDEPTAAVDAESEEHIFHTIERMEGKTRILISHRFSTVRNADTICILDGGIVRELGTHDELMKQSGEYARLFRMQAKGYMEDETD